MVSDILPASWTFLKDGSICSAEVPLSVPKGESAWVLDSADVEQMRAGWWPFIVLNIILQLDTQDTFLSYFLCH